ncbi:MAG TPA: 2-keto-3-deoxy-L-rhamnonate aldolase, partial [Firmicutes bacterium]|nr:2-keto-3-deoxy-L-rhamnonate aldolase [Bacillota bacterium]
VVPFINTAADAKLLTRYAMYPPKGIRGIGPRRAQYLADGPWDYQRNANEEIVVLIPQIEHIDAVNNLDDICAVEGIGGLFLGPSDLSLSLGHGGEYDHPEVVAAKRQILDASRKHNLPLAVASTGIDDARYWVGEGAKLVMVAGDASLISSGMTRILVQVRT